MAVLKYKNPNYTVGGTEEKYLPLFNIVDMLDAYTKEESDNRYPKKSDIVKIMPVEVFNMLSKYTETGMTMTEDDYNTLLPFVTTTATSSSSNYGIYIRTFNNYLVDHPNMGFVKVNIEDIPSEISIQATATLLGYMDISLEWIISKEDKSVKFGQVQRQINTNVAGEIGIDFQSLDFNGSTIGASITLKANGSGDKVLCDNGEYLPILDAYTKEESDNRYPKKSDVVKMMPAEVFDMLRNYTETGTMTEDDYNTILSFVTTTANYELDKRLLINYNYLVDHPNMGFIKVSISNASSTININAIASIPNYADIFPEWIISKENKLVEVRQSLRWINSDAAGEISIGTQSTDSNGSITSGTGITLKTNGSGDKVLCDNGHYLPINIRPDGVQLDAEPTEDTLTYTVGNVTYNFELGMSAICQDSSADNGRSVYLFKGKTDEGKAIWWKTGSTYQHPSHTAHESGLYKITTDGLGHVSDAISVTKADITSLGIPEQDTTYVEATTSTSGLMSSSDKTKIDRLESYTTATTVASLDVNYQTIYVTLSENASLSASDTGVAYNGRSIMAYVYTASSVTITIPTSGNYVSMCGSSFTTTENGWVEFSLVCVNGVWHIAKLEAE